MYASSVVPREARSPSSSTSRTWRSASRVERTSSTSVACWRGWFEKGDIVVKRAYADWKRFGDYSRALYEAARSGSVRVRRARSRRVRSLVRRDPLRRGDRAPVAAGGRRESWRGHAHAGPPRASADGAPSAVPAGAHDRSGFFRPLTIGD